MIFLILNGLVFLVLLQSLAMFLSGFPAMGRWYDPSGIQYLGVVVISAPLLVVLAVALRSVGGALGASRLNRNLPWLAALALTAAVLAGELSTAAMKFSGLGICLSGLLACFWTTMSDGFGKRPAP